MSAGGEKKVYFVGEGPNEIGSLAGDPAYRDDKMPGVLQVLLGKVAPTGWVTGGGRPWKVKAVRKLRVNPGGHADTKHVLALANDALDAGHDVLAFLRDVDGDSERVEAVEQGLRLVAETMASLRCIGVVAIPELEAWVLALCGEWHTETRGKLEERLKARGISLKDTAAYVEVAKAADLTRVPEDATSLLLWLRRASEVFPQPRPAGELP